MASRVVLKDTQREQRIFGARSLVALGFVVLLLGLLLARYYNLQINEFEVYSTASERNRVQLQPLPPKRGLIYDRNGVLLADNRPSYTLSLILERVEDLEATLAALGELVTIEDSDLEKFRTRARQRRPYDPVPLRFRLNDVEQAYIAVNRHRLPGVTVEAQLQRYYPHGELFAHALGYVGRINTQEMASIDQAAYRGTFHIGKIGLERRYENELHGEVGYQTVETNAHGRVLRVLERFDPSPGEDLILHLDYELQRVAHEQLAGRRGAVVAIDPLTGGVLAMVSTPAFDSNLFVNGISSRDYNALRDSRDVPLFNRTVQGQYPPGSTVKPMIAMAGLEAGLIDPEFTVPDPGWYRLPGDRRRYRDWILRIRGTGHAPEVDLKMALAESCDVYFYDLARRLTVDGIHNYLDLYGLGRRTGIDTTAERPGVLPSKDWKRGALGQPWYPGETLSVGIGQGYMLTTPLQLAVATSVLATRGEHREPRLVQWLGDDALEAPMVAPLIADGAHWDAVVEGMREVVHGRRGTAKAIARGMEYEMAGKTGTAQVIGIAQDAVYDEDEIDERHRNHGLFIAFAPLEAPTIAVAVIVENGGGSSAAYPIARAVVDAWLDREPS
ncbi:penicillin-binding protein 2 [Congregibacter litoralis]|uniref:Peptidoglycan D,D-transpeptidase MrdA n=1 Tax=Congregibacter litoralis KT71 TaxID=314285 RepID=A4A9N7_9GAMM|nr:penicillin-binding protein 2 [Congregibacter litoralis]EAQ97204.1 penicillin-binding protein 2 [Congregibacter litoralis KT71]